MKKQDLLYYIVGALVIICGIWLGIKVLKAGLGLVKGLIYVPFEIVGGKAVNQGFGNAMPDRMSRFNTQTDLIIG